MSSVETKINYMMRRLPFLKLVLKRAYQGLFSLGNIGFASSDNLTRVSPRDEYEYLFGYYDKSPWASDNQKMICLRVKEAFRSAESCEAAQIVQLCGGDSSEFYVLGETHCWNVQQGCMLQWLGPDFSTKILYNDFRDGAYCAVVLNVVTGEESILPMPVYSVSSDGKFALSLDFSRLHALRPGYGYANIPSARDTIDPCPDETCIWRVDIESGRVDDIVTYEQLAQINRLESMIGAIHKVNHIMISPDLRHFMVLHRWLQGASKFSRLMVFDMHGLDSKVMLADDMVSHCCWEDNETIVAYANTFDEGIGYYRINVRTNERSKIWRQLERDGHPSFSPSGSLAVTDTYPDRGRISHLYLVENQNVFELARVKMPFRYDNDTRCDLHPRWSRDGKKICIDSAHEGRRAMYTISVSANELTV